MQREKTKALEIDGMLVSTFKEPYNELLDEAPNGTYTFHVSSQTDQDKVYLVQTRRRTPSWSRARRRGIGEFTHYDYLCTCPDYSIRRFQSYEDCKHIKVVKFFARLPGSLAALNSLEKLVDFLREE